MLKVSTFLTSIKPLMYFSRLFGVSSFTIVKHEYFEKPIQISKSLLVYSFVAMVAVIGLEMYCNYVYLSINNDNLVNTAGLCETIMYLAANICIYFSNFVFRRRMDLLISKLCSLDEVLPNYACFYTKIFWLNIIICIIIPLPLINYISSLNFNENFHWQGIVDGCEAISAILVSCIGFQFIILVIVIGLKCLALNSNIVLIITYLQYKEATLCEDETISIYKTSEKFKIPLQNDLRISAKEIVRLRKLYDEICDIAEITNNLFSIELLLISACHFIGLTDMAYMLSMFLLEGGNNFTQEILDMRTILFYLCWGLANLLTMVFVCDAASSKSQVTAVLVSKLLNEPIKDDIKRELKIFSHQILHRKIRFTACGFFVLDFTLLHTIVGAVTTYLIILIQFYLSSRKSNGTPNVDNSLVGDSEENIISPQDF